MSADDEMSLIERGWMLLEDDKIHAPAVQAGIMFSEETAKLYAKYRHNIEAVEVEVIRAGAYQGAVEALRWAVEWIEGADDAPLPTDPGADWEHLEAARRIVRGQ